MNVKTNNNKLHANTVQDTLRNEILLGTIKPNTNLRQQAIAERFNISRTPAREALKGLEAEGLVENTAHVGFKVREFKLRDIIEITDVRALIEGYAAALAAKANDRDLPKKLYEIADKTENANKRYEESFDKQDFQDTVRLEHEFHQKIVEASGNSLIIRMYRSLNLQLFVGTRDDFLKMTQGDRPHHRDIVKAIEENDPDKAEKLAKKHLDYKQDLLTKHLGPIAIY